MITVSGRGFDALASKLRRKRERLRTEVRSAVKEATLLVHTRVRASENWAQLTANPTPATKAMDEGALAKLHKRTSAPRLARLHYKALPPPGPLRRITSHLANSIKYRVEDMGETGARGVVGTVTKYARPHEEGMTITVAPRSRRAMVAGERQVKLRRGRDGTFTPQLGRKAKRSIKAHGVGSFQIRIPARPFLKPQLDRERETIRAMIAEAVRRAMADEV